MGNEEVDVSTIPSSAGALQRQERGRGEERIRFTPEEEGALAREARRLVEQDKFVSLPLVLNFMSRRRPLFDAHSPKSVENKLRSCVREHREGDFWVSPAKRRRSRRHV